MDTIKLFEQDAYLKHCEAEVVAVENNQVILNQTVFYPLGGGQPGDTGLITRSDGMQLRVSDTRKNRETPGVIIHWVDDAEKYLKSGDVISAAIDWDNRYRYMRTHTCMHVFCSLLDYPVTGGNISLQKGRLDFDMPDKPDKQELTDQLNQLISNNVELNYRWITDEEMQANMDLVKTMSVKPPMGLGKVRLVEIPGIDLQPCGGTHVKNTSEIGRVSVAKIENKGKQNKRINLLLED